MRFHLHTCERERMYLCVCVCVCDQWKPASLCHDVSMLGGDFYAIRSSNCLRIRHFRDSKMKTVHFPHSLREMQLIDFRCETQAFLIQTAL
jgi:hypothetical protein